MKISDVRPRRRGGLLLLLTAAAAALTFTMTAPGAVPPGPGTNPFVNPGFENTCIFLPVPIAVFPIPGWTVVGLGTGTWVEVPSNFPGNPGGAQSGFCFALGTAGTANTFATMTQTVNLGFGNQIRGYVRFTNNDPGPCPTFNDTGRVRIYRVGPIGGTFTAFTADSCFSGIATGTSTPWTLWTFQAPSAGAYMVSYEIANIGDGAFASVLSADSNGLGSVSISPKP